MRYRDPRPPLFWALCGLSFAALVWLDRHVAFVYMPRWIPAIPVVLFLFPTRVDSSYWLRAAVVVGLALAPFALGPVRWNTLKSFYVDCATIEPGTALSEVQRRMQAYHLQRSATGDSTAANPLERPHLTYHPDEFHSADWCVVTTEGTQVAGVFIFPD